MISSWFASVVWCGVGWVVLGVALGSVLGFVLGIGRSLELNGLWSWFLQLFPWAVLVS